MSGELLHPRARRVWRRREEMVLRLLDEGLSYTEMAARLGISAHRLRVIGERAAHRRTDPKHLTLGCRHKKIGG